MNNQSSMRTKITTGILFLVAFLPMSAQAQAFVPVIDIQLNPAFNNYVNQFNSTLTGAPDSIRDIISGGDPGGVAQSTCAQRDADDYAFAYSDGPWAQAVASSTDNGGTLLPDAIPAPNVKVQVNGSGSLRCLLMELNGYQKTSLYVQFHGLLKQYISDAQQQQLSNQLLGQINAANLNWAKGGVQVNNGGILTSEPVYVTNISDSVFTRNERTVNHIVNQAAASPGDPIGSLEACDPIGAATQIAKSLRSRGENPLSYTTSATRCTLDSPTGPFVNRADLTDFMEDPNTVKAPGALFTFNWMLNNPQDTPVGEINLAESEAFRRTNFAEQNYREELQGSGFQPTQACSGNPDDPFCLPELAINVSPTTQNQTTVVSAVESGKEQISNSYSADTGAPNEAENLSTQANTLPGGTLGYDPTALGSTQTTVNRLIEELYDSIRYAYFDLDGDQEDWASAALFSIYDEMTFDDENPNVQVTEGTAREPLFY